MSQPTTPTTFVEVVEAHCLDLSRTAHALRGVQGLKRTADECDKAVAELRAAILADRAQRPTVAGSVDTPEFRNLLARVWHQQSIEGRDIAAAALINHIDARLAPAAPSGTPAAPVVPEGYVIMPAKLTHEQRVAAKHKLGFTQMYAAAVEVGAIQLPAPVVAEGFPRLWAVLRLSDKVIVQTSSKEGWLAEVYGDAGKYAIAEVAPLAAHPVAVSQNDIEMVRGALDLCEPEDQAAFKRILNQVGVK